MLPPENKVMLNRKTVMTTILPTNQNMLRFRWKSGTIIMVQAHVLTGSNCVVCYWQGLLVRFSLTWGSGGEGESWGEPSWSLGFLGMLH